MENQVPVIATDPNKNKKRNYIIGGVIFVILLIIGAIATFWLTQQNQDVRQQASNAVSSTVANCAPEGFCISASDSCNAFYGTDNNNFCAQGADGSAQKCCTPQVTSSNGAENVTCDDIGDCAVWLIGQDYCKDHGGYFEYSVKCNESTNRCEIPTYSCKDALHESEASKQTCSADSDCMHWLDTADYCENYGGYSSYSSTCNLSIGRCNEPTWTCKEDNTTETGSSRQSCTRDKDCEDWVEEMDICLNGYASYTAKCDLSINKCKEPTWVCKGDETTNETGGTGGGGGSIGQVTCEHIPQYEQNKLTSCPAGYTELSWDHCMESECINDRFCETWAVDCCQNGTIEGNYCTGDIAGFITKKRCTDMVCSDDGGTTTTVGPQCLNISISKTAPQVGDSVTFTCGAVAGVDEYIFRLADADGNIVDLGQSSSRISQPYILTKAGLHIAQCNICVDGVCNEWEPLMSTLAR